MFLALAEYTMIYVLLNFTALSVEGEAPTWPYGELLYRVTNNLNEVSTYNNWNYYDFVNNLRIQKYLGRRIQVKMNQFWTFSLRWSFISAYLENS